MSLAPEKKRTPLMMAVCNFIKGGIAGCIATSCVIPTDVLKTWVQLQSEAGFKNIKFKDGISSIFKQRGFKGFYTGLDAALVRQFTFAAFRIGIFLGVVDFIQAKKHRTLTIVEKSCAAMTMGAIGALAINPFDTVLVRMWSDLKLPPEQQRHYKNIFNGLYRIVKEEGVTTLWRAATPNLLRAVVLNVGMMTPFQECKERLSPHIKNEFAVSSISSCIAGVCASVVSLPFDNAKVKIQKMIKNPDGTMPYKGFIDCFAKTISREGFFRLWAGFIIFSINLGPHAIISLMSTDIIRKYLKL
jgi:solute carrier family 25 (mitochondrial oxoglutarate transporter), member 11